VVQTASGGGGAGWSASAKLIDIGISGECWVRRRGLVQSASNCGPLRPRPQSAPPAVEESSYTRQGLHVVSTRAIKGGAQWQSVALVELS
jgi:hypothetical protein